MCVFSTLVKPPGFLLNFLRFEFYLELKLHAAFVLGLGLGLGLGLKLELGLGHYWSIPSVCTIPVVFNQIA